MTRRCQSIAGLLLLASLIVPAYPAGPLRAGADGITFPQLRHKVDPRFPEKAYVRRIGALVILEAVVLKDGSVHQPQVLKCSAPGYGFEEAAVEAIRRWEYEPGRSRGEPVDVYFTAIVEFGLSPDPTSSYIPNNEWTSAYLGALRYLSAQNFDEAAAFVHGAKEVAEKAFTKRDPRLAWTFEAAASLHIGRQEVDEAGAALQQALSAYENAYGKKCVELTPILTMLAGVHMSRGQPSDAEPLLLRALAIREKRLGKDSIDVSASLYRLAIARLDLGRGDEARADLERALEVSMASESRDPRLEVKIHSTLARHLASEQDPAQAASHWEAAITILETGTEATGTDMLDALQHYRECLRSAGRDDEADAVDARIKDLAGPPSR